MRRRDAIGSLLAFATVVGSTGVAAEAAKGTKPFRIAALPNLSPTALSWLSDDMRTLGWIGGDDFIVHQSGEWKNDAELDEAARRVVADKPDLIISTRTNCAIALQRATPTIPVVMLASGYPVEVGLANSLARPGKNVTGNAIYAGYQIWGKLLQLLLEIKSGAQRVSVLFTYIPPSTPREEIEPAYAELRDAARRFDVNLHMVEAENATVARALAEIEVERPDALVLTSGLQLSAMANVMQFAVEKRLPTIADVAWPVALDPYPLLSYGVLWRELVRNVAMSVDKILKGINPGDIPIQQPSRFEMLVNLKTAKMIGLTITPELLLRADRVIE